MQHGIITIQVEVLKALSRKKLILLTLTWEDMLNLPISGDELQLDRHTLKITQGPLSDETLLNRPQAAAGPENRWLCIYAGEWVRAETLAGEFRKDPRVQGVELVGQVPV